MAIAVKFIATFECTRWSSKKAPVGRINDAKASLIVCKKLSRLTHGALEMSQHISETVLSLDLNL